MNIADRIRALPETEPGRRRPPLGILLRARADLGPEEIEEVLAARNQGSGRFGDLVAAAGLATETEIAEALAEQRGLAFVDVAADPPETDLLARGEPTAWLAEGAIPWRRQGGVTVYAVTDPDRAAPAIARLGGAPLGSAAVLTTRSALETAVAAASGQALADRAAGRTPAAQSVRGIGGLRRWTLAVLAGAALALAVGGPLPLAIALVLIFTINVATTALRLAAVFAGRASPGAEAERPRPGRRETPMPRISVLVPLYREANMIPGLLAALARINYPRDRLEVRLLLEEDDSETRAAVARTRLPSWVIPMVVPAGLPRTKPRALNYALDFCRGEIVGILDAEDRPDPDQLRDVVSSFDRGGPEMACVQCQLAYYNARDNWLSRCFQIEYAIWFEVLLPGFRALGLPIPLGGTSVYFRREAVAEIGGWDAHNVTEDADLGMRLARAGHGVGVLRSVTEEEANCRLAPWVRQRSRWLKGYLMTWLSHMRRPGALWRDLGLRGFLGLNLLFVGAATAYLAMPLFWIAVIGWAVHGVPLWQSALPAWVIWPAMVSLAVGQMVMLACATLAMMRRRSTWLLWWVVTLPLYWTLGAIAAWKAVLELVAAPFYWDKTPHGLSGAPQRRPGPLRRPCLPWQRRAGEMRPSGERLVPPPRLQRRAAAPGPERRDARPAAVPAE